MTDLRKRMLEELQRRNYSPTTIRCYVRVVEDFAGYFGKRPDHLTREHMREYHLHLLQKRKLTPKTVGLHIAALRFFFVKTLRRPYVQVDLPYPKMPERLPTVLSQEEVARLINSARNLLDYTMLMTLYGTGMRRAELIRLKTEDIDSQRMIVHIRQGPRCAIATQAARDVTGVLAVDEAQDVSVSRYGERLACRQTPHTQVCVDCSTRCSEAGRNP